MKSMMFFAGAATLAATVAAGAQAANGAGTGQMDQMNMTKVYVGCLARTKDGHYTLTNASVADMKSDKPMSMDTMAMGKDTMGKDAMSKDAMGKDTMGKDAMGKDAMGQDDMMSLTLGLTSAKVDLGKHVGHQVTASGVDAQPMGKMAMFTVTSLTMVANTCAKVSGR